MPKSQRTSSKALMLPPFFAMLSREEKLIGEGEALHSVGKAGSKLTGKQRLADGERKSYPALVCSLVLFGQRHCERTNTASILHPLDGSRPNSGRNWVGDKRQKDAVFRILHSAFPDPRSKLPLASVRTAFMPSNMAVEKFRSLAQRVCLVAWMVEEGEEAASCVDAFLGQQRNCLHGPRPVHLLDPEKC